MKADPHEYNVYVLEARDRVGKVIFYVGSTGKEPEQRLRDHSVGCKRYCPFCRCRKYVRGPRMRLRKELYSHYNPVGSRERAEVIERWLTRQLRQRGYTVIGH